MPTGQPSATHIGHRWRRGVPSAVGRDRWYTTAYPSTVASAGRRHELSGRFARRVARPPRLTPEEQFRLLEVALRIKLRHEGKPEDAITLQRPANLPAPPGTPLRQPCLVPHRGERVGVRGGVGGHR